MEAAYLSFMGSYKLGDHCIHPPPRNMHRSPRLASPLASMHTLSGLRSRYAMCLLCRCLSARASCAAHTLPQNPPKNNNNKGKRDHGTPSQERGREV